MAAPLLIEIRFAAAEADSPCLNCRCLIFGNQHAADENETQTLFAIFGDSERSTRQGEFVLRPNSGCNSYRGSGRPLRRFENACPDFGRDFRRRIKTEMRGASGRLRMLTSGNAERMQDGRRCGFPVAHRNGGMLGDLSLMKISDCRCRLSEADGGFFSGAKEFAEDAGMDDTVREFEISAVAVQDPKSGTFMQRIFGGRFAEQWRRFDQSRYFP